MIELKEHEKEIVLKPITREYVHSLRGKFRGKGLLKALRAEKKRERDLMTRRSKVCSTHDQ
jgi:hypothetical protein